MYLFSSKNHCSIGKNGSEKEFISPLPNRIKKAFPGCLYCRPVSAPTPWCCVGKVVVPSLVAASIETLQAAIQNEVFSQNISGVKPCIVQKKYLGEVYIYISNRNLFHQPWIFWLFWGECKTFTKTFAGLVDIFVEDSQQRLLNNPYTL